MGLVEEQSISSQLHWPVLGICGGMKKDRVAFAETLRLRLTEAGFVVAVLEFDTFSIQQGAKEVELSLLTSDAVLVLTGDPAVPYSRLSFVRDILKASGNIRSQHPLLVDMNGTDLELFCNELVAWFAGQWFMMPVIGCMLVGGKSSRMGTAKHLIRCQGETWAERTVKELGTQVDQVVVSGAGELPPSLHALEQVEDVEGLAGPVAGILAVLRRYPMTSLLVAACDLPDMNSKALEWILSHRKPGVRGVLPDLDGQGRVEPLLAYYDFRCRPRLEALVADGSLRINRVRKAKGVISPRPPAFLRGCWRNVNTLKELTRQTKG